MNVVSRRADAFATKHGYGHQLKTALTKLEVENASAIKNHWLVSLIKGRCGSDKPSEA